jgi:hypothetical protein
MGLKRVVEHISESHQNEALEIGDTIKLNVREYSSEYLKTTECMIYKMEVSLHLVVHETFKMLLKLWR